MTFRRFARALPFLATTILLQHCTTTAGNSSQYAPADQDAAVARATGRFASDDGKFVVEICEASKDSPAVSDCQDSYVIQSGGRGTRISDGKSGGVGCGGCPFDGVVLPVRATLQLDAPAATYDGTADWGRDDGSSLQRDSVEYRFIMANGNSIQVNVTLRANGSMELRELSQSPRILPTLKRTGAAVCPRP
jgi:hypothetical protein